MSPTNSSSVTSYPSVVAHLLLKFEDKLTIRVNEGEGFVNEQLVTDPGSIGAQVMNRVPTKCSVEFQGHTQAATFKLTFDYRELPIDPRTVVAARVEIYAGTVSPEDFADGIQHEVSPGVRRSILKTRTPEGRTIDKDLLMVGLVDVWNVEHSEDGGEVHLEGRDLRGLLLDSPLVTPRDQPQRRGARPQPRTGGAHHPQRRRTSILDRLDCSQNIAALVLQILEEHDQIRKLPFPIEVSCRAEQFEDGVIPSPGAASHIPRHRKGAAGRGSASGGGSDNLNFWDIITRYCYLVGCVPRFVGRKLVISPGRALFASLQHEFDRTAFAGNAVRTNEATGDVWGIRRLVYGRDIKSLKISRKYAGHAKPKTVRVVSVNRSAPTRGHSNDRLLEALWPPRNAAEARRDGLSTGHGRDLRDSLGGQESSEILNVPVTGINNMAQLVSIAQSLYEQIGRGEIKGDIESAGLTSFGGSNADPDLLRLRVGDPVEVLVDASALDNRSPIASTLNRTMQLPFSQAVAEVRRYLRDENLSRAIVASARGEIMGVLRYFRVSDVSYDWSSESLTVKMGIQNYWTPRWDYVTAVDQQRRAQQRSAADHRRAAENASVVRPVEQRRNITERLNDLETGNAEFRRLLGRSPDPPSTATLGAPDADPLRDPIVSRWRNIR